MCIIRYVKITHVTPSVKFFSCFFVSVGFRFIDIMFSLGYKLRSRFTSYLDYKYVFYILKVLSLCLSYIQKHDWVIISGFWFLLGLVVTTRMFVTTCLMTMVMIIMWKQQIIIVDLFLVLFWSIELFYL